MLICMPPCLFFADRTGILRHLSFTVTVKEGRIASLHFVYIYYPCIFHWLPWETKWHLPPTHIIWLLFSPFQRNFWSIEDCHSYRPDTEKNSSDSQGTQLLGISLVYSFFNINIEMQIIKHRNICHLKILLIRSSLFIRSGTLVIHFISFAVFNFSLPVFLFYSIKDKFSGIKWKAVHRIYALSALPHKSIIHGTCDYGLLHLVAVVVFFPCPC